MRKPTSREAADRQAREGRARKQEHRPLREVVREKELRERMMHEPGFAAAMGRLQGVTPELIARARKEGHLAADGPTAVKQLLDLATRAEAEARAQREAKDERDADLLEWSRVASEAQIDHAERLAAAKGYPGLREHIARLQWRELLTDPGRVTAFVAESGGERQAIQRLHTHGVADMVPLALESYISGKGQDFAEAAGRAGASSSTRYGALLRSAPFQSFALRALLRRGVNWQERHPSPAHAAIAALAEVAERGGERQGLHEASGWSEEQVEQGLLELIPELGDAQAARAMLAGIREGALENGLLTKLAKRDAEVARPDPKPTPEAKDAAERRRLIAEAYDRNQTRERGIDPADGSEHELPDAERMTAHSERKAALIEGYAKLSGRKVVMDASSEGLREIEKEDARSAKREADEERSRLGTLSRAYDEIEGRASSPEPSRPPVAKDTGASRREVLSAAFDALEESDK